MANTYSQLYIHFVFGVQNRLGLIQKEWCAELYKYISSIIENKGNKIYAIGGMPDHIHILVSMSASQSPSSLMADVKRSSSLWINENKFVKGKFSWQEGFGCFSYGKSQVDKVIKYIIGQETHHTKKTFREEYVELLRLFNIEYDEKYIFKEVQ